MKNNERKKKNTRVFHKVTKDLDVVIYEISNNIMEMHYKFHFFKRKS